MNVVSTIAHVPFVGLNMQDSKDESFNSFNENIKFANCSPNLDIRLLPFLALSYAGMDC